MRDGLGRVRTVLLLGGDSDIGVAIALRLVRDGARDVILAGRDPAKMAARESALHDAGATTVRVERFDADDTETHADFFQSTFATGHIDAAIIAFGLLGEHAQLVNDPGAAMAVVRTNLLGGASALTNLCELMRDQGQGAIVVLSSVAAQRPRLSNFVYGASKAGLDALAEGMAFTLRDQGVQILTVRPGFVETKMTAGRKKTPFATTPERVARETVRALAGGKELIWSPPALRYVMWVLRLIPREIFRRLKV